MRKILQMVVVVAVLTFTACQSSGPASLTEADKAAIEASLAEWVKGALANDWAAVAATYTEDAVLMPPNSPIVEGRANIQAYFEGFPPVRAMTATNVEVLGQGDTAYVRGTYTMTIAAEDAEAITDTGKYLEVRKKQPDGSWLLHRDMFSSDLAAQ